MKARRAAFLRPSQRQGPAAERSTLLIYSAIKSRGVPTRGTKADGKRVAESVLADHHIEVRIKPSLVQVRSQGA